MWLLNVDGYIWIWGGGGGGGRENMRDPGKRRHGVDGSGDRLNLELLLSRVSIIY